MLKSAVIGFDDDSKIFVDSETKIIALGKDSYQIAVIYDLDGESIQKFTSKKLKYFRIHNYIHEIDKWGFKDIDQIFDKMRRIDQDNFDSVKN